jgi:hypothetical protein
LTQFEAPFFGARTAVAKIAVGQAWGTRKKLMLLIIVPTVFASLLIYLVESIQHAVDVVEICWKTIAHFLGGI